MQFRTLALALALGSGLLAGGAHAKDTYNLTVQTIFQAGSVNEKAIDRFADNVKEMSGGRLTLDIRPIGSVVGYTETVDAANSGVIDGQISFPGYFSGQEPGLGALADLPGGYSNPYQAQEMMQYDGGLKLLREMYKKLGMYTVGTVWWGVESMPTTTPLRSVSDFKGIKVRAPQGMASTLFTKLGAAVVNLPGSEVYGAFEKGVIDATDWGTLAMNDDAGLHDVATGFIYPGIHSMPMADVSIAMSRWKQLPPDLQAILKVATRDLARDMVQSNALRDAETLQKLKSKGLKQYDWSDAQRRKFRQIASTVWKSYGKKSDFAKKAIGLQIGFLKAHGYMK